MQVGVLLMEPDEDLRYWVGRLLERSEGFTLRASCSRADEVEDMVHRLAPQLVLLDCKAMAGPEAGIISRLKARPSAPFVVLTGSDDEKSLERLARNAGADGFFDKTRALQSLLKIRQSILARAGGAQAVPAQG